MSEHRPTTNRNPAPTRSTIRTVILRAVQLFFAQWIVRKILRRRR